MIHFDLNCDKLQNDWKCHWICVLLYIIVQNVSAL